MRRLPIFILVDTYGKMQGERIELVNRKIRELVSNLRQDPFALESAYISMASFNLEMQVCFPLTELSSVIDFPILEAKLNTPSMLGNALYLLESIFEKNIKKTTEDKGDWKPVLCILTGGKPSDTASAHDSMVQLLSKQKMKLCLGLTSSLLVPFYENLFEFGLQTGVITINTLNCLVENFRCAYNFFPGIAIGESNFRHSQSISTSLSSPPKEIHIGF